MACSVGKHCDSLSGRFNFVPTSQPNGNHPECDDDTADEYQAETHDAYFCSLTLSELAKLDAIADQSARHHHYQHNSQ
jgi:hypothetical protein